jgi:hypothetical protein
MATIKEEIMSIAEKQGYEGEGGSTIAEAVNALGSVMGGGGECPVIPLTQTRDTSSGQLVYAIADGCTITWNALRDAAKRGDDVRCVLDTGTYGNTNVTVFHLDNLFDSEDNSYAVFGNTHYNVNIPSITTIQIESRYDQAIYPDFYLTVNPGSTYTGTKTLATK